MPSTLQPFWLVLFSFPMYASSAIAVTPCALLSVAFSCKPLDEVLAKHQADYPILTKVLAAPEKYQVQILYTRLEPNITEPRLHYYHYQVDPNRYFYPASTIKLPLAALALQWLTEQQIPHLNENSTMLTMAARSPQTAAYQDPTSPTGLPSIRHYIKKILLVSDNDASNRLYELLGQQYINEELRKKGLLHTVVNHRLSVPFSDDDNRYFNPVQFLDDDGKAIHQLAERQISASYQNLAQPKLGRAYYKAGKRIEMPMDFTLKNRQSIIYFDGVIKRIVLPKLFPTEQRFTFY